MLESFGIVTLCIQISQARGRWRARGRHLVAGLAAAACKGVAAASLASSGVGVPMGQPLDFAVQLRLEPEESITAECVSAEVALGDRRLSAGAVRAVLETTSPQRAVVRVQTQVAVDEPVVEVQFHARCGAVQISRRFVLLADPPLQPPVTAPALPLAVPVQALVPAQVPASAPTAPDANASPGSAAMGADSAVSGGPATGAAGAGPSRAALAGGPAGATQDRPQRAAAAQAARAPRPRATAAATGRAQPRSPRRAAVAAAAPLSTVPAPRLRLEPVQALATGSGTAAAIDEALAAVAEAASAARQAASAASAAQARIAGLEAEAAALRREIQARRDEALQVRERLQAAEQAGRWTWPLLATVLLLTALAAWLAWRLNTAERARQRAWQAAEPAHAPGPASELTPSKLPTRPIPFVTSELSLPAPAPKARAVRAWPAPVPLDTQPPPEPQPRTVSVVRPAEPPPRPAFDDSPMLRTEPLPPQGALEPEAARDVSIEELLDLEQQAEFFVVLGQDEAAIDLLMEHLRHTGGGSPLPYLKLLEIYHRRGERETYERMRTRFNHRFNAYAPEWGVDLQAGRSLESYPGVVPRLQQVWARPLDAMAELEALLFRKSRGELFDLPAYREVLFLYSMARDLLDREAAGAGQVDLLLPLFDDAEDGTTAPAPFGIEPTGDAAATRRTALDLDLDLPGTDSGPTSLFGPLDDPLTRPPSH